MTASEHDPAQPLFSGHSGLIRRQGVVRRLAQRAKGVGIRQDEQAGKRQGAGSGGGLDAVADDFKRREHTKTEMKRGSGPERTRAPGRKPTVRKPHQGNATQGLSRRLEGTDKYRRTLAGVPGWLQSRSLLQWLNHATARPGRQGTIAINRQTGNQAALECCATRASTTSTIFCC